MNKTIQLLTITLLSVLLFSCGSSSSNKNSNSSTNNGEGGGNNPTPPNKSDIKIAIIGDQSISDNAHKLLKMIKNEGVELLLINGDFDYKNNPAAWKKMHDNILGSDFPIIAVAGNHDADDSWELWQEYQRITADWDANPNLSCTGTPGEQSTCIYKGIKIVSVSPNQFDYDHVDYINKEFDGDNGWKICAWHKNMTKMQTGNKLDEAGWGVYEACKEQGALITTAHEHAYARSYLFNDIEHQVIADNDPKTANLKRGETIVILSGLGGKSSRPLQRDDSWWAHRENANTGAVAGALICSFGKASNKADCYFKDIKKGVVDTFTLTK